MQSSDNKKIRLELLPPNVLEEVGRVFAAGAEKYSEYGWKGVVSTPQGYANYMGSCYRHLVRMHIGEAIDFDSNHLHAAHVVANGMILCWATMNMDVDTSCSDKSVHYWRIP